MSKKMTIKVTISGAAASGKTRALQAIREALISEFMVFEEHTEYPFTKVPTEVWKADFRLRKDKA